MEMSLEVAYSRVSMTDKEISLLKKCIGNNKIIVEIGSYIGKTTCALAENNKVIAIDPFIDGYDPDDQVVMLGVEEIFKKRIKGKDIIWYKAKSEDVLKSWEIMIDGVFIDGNHMPEALNEDVKWIGFVKKGGIIAFHDYNYKPSVTNFVDEKIRPKYQEIGRERFLIVWRK